MRFYKEKTNILVTILVAAFILPVAYSFYFHIVPAIDAAAYDHIALHILAGKGFVEGNSPDIFFDNAIVRAGPLYEYFLAGIYAVAGHHYAAVWIIQALLHAATAFLLFLICKRIFAENGAVIGLLAAAMFGFHPDLIEISAMLMTETLYLFLVTLVVFLFVKIYGDRERIWLSGALGLVMGCAILIRPPVLLFLPIILVFYACRRHYAACAVFLAIFVGILMPWVLRNYSIYHQFIPTTLIGEYNIWVGNLLTSNGGQISEGYNPASKYTETLGYMRFADAARNYARAFVFMHPVVMMKLVGLRALRYFSLIRPMGFWFYQHGMSQAIFIASSLISIAFLFVAGSAGVVLALQERKRIFYYLASFMVAAPIALLPAVVESRYRFQIYPFFAIFGAYFLIRLWYRHREALKSLVIVGTAYFIVSTVDVVLFWQTVSERIRPIFK